MTIADFARVALAVTTAFVLSAYGDVGCGLDPHGCPGVVVANGESGPGMDPNG